MAAAQTKLVIRKRNGLWRVQFKQMTLYSFSSWQDAAIFAWKLQLNTING